MPERFRRDGFDHLQVANIHPVYIYKKTKGDWEGYEVVIARQNKGRIINGKVIEPGWSYPSSESWGTYGWSCATRQRAAQLAGQLVTAMPVPAPPSGDCGGGE